MGAYKKKVGRVVYVDLTDVHVPKPSILRAAAAARVKNERYKRERGYNLLGNNCVYRTAADLKKGIDEYFESCLGPIYSKYGQKILDDEGKPVIRVVRPYTISGLARHLGIATQTLLSYNKKAAMGLLDEEYFNVLQDAMQLIESYAEGRLYDRDGSAGGTFVLRTGFGWMTKQEKTDRKLKIAKAKIEKLEHAAKMELLKQGQEVGNNEGIEIRVVRARKKDEEETC